MSFTGIVIPFYNGEAYIGACVKSLLANDVPAEHIYIVDNSPAENGLSELLAGHGGLKIIRTKSRLGFGRASNIGAEAAIKDGACRLLLTNQDTILDAGCVERLTQALEQHPELAIIAPMNYTYGFEGMEDSYVKYFLSQCPSLVADALRGSAAGVYEVQNVVGSCFMVRAECVRELGLFDEIFFMYNEDEDLCRRYRLAGRRIAVLPTARVAHAHSLTSPKDSGTIDGWTRRSQIVFILKDPTQPLWRCVGRAFHAATEDYIRSAARLDLGKVFQLAKDDLRESMRWGELLDSRRKEKKILQAQANGPAGPGVSKKAPFGPAAFHES